MKTKNTLRLATALVGIGFVASSELLAQTTPGPQPTICSRSCWAARAGSCTTSLGSLTRAIIHHTAGPSDYTTDYATAQARMRSNQNYHMDSNGWCDIGYHFLVSAGGHIFEGRAGSLGASSGWKRGAHDGCNANSMGFTCLGYFHTPYNHAYTQTIQDAISAVIAWRLPSGWNPNGSSTYCSVSVGYLDGHYKVKSTACPGTLIINGLQATRDNVAARRSGSVNNASVVSVSAPSSVSAGSSFSATITMNNNGTTTWTADGTPHGLGSQNPQDNTRWGTTRVALPGNVGPGSNCAFTRTFTAPTTPGTYAFDWKMVEDGVQWFGATATHTITVTDPVTNPPHYFGSNAEGWTAGNASTAITWTDCCGWPGVIYADQNGDDSFWMGPNAGFTGAADASVNISVYPQNGTTANHNMQLFWKTATQNFFDAVKSTPIVSYTAQNGWINLNLNAANAEWSGKTINQLRLDFDNSNSSTRWLVNHIYTQVTPKYWFGTSASGWTSGNGLSAIQWISDATWPGCIYADQTANDAYFFSPGISFLGGANDRFRVNVYPQNGAATHDMQVFWKTSAENFFSADKSSPVVNYTAQNTWADLTLDVGSNPKWSGQFVTQIRLDVDQVNSGTRWIIDYSVVSLITDITTVSTPAAPSGLTATAVSSSQVSLSWTDNSSNEDSFVVARGTTAGGPYNDIATLGANNTTYGDSGLTSATTYYYVVRAVNAGGSASSAEANATTLSAPPAAPSGLTASAVSSSQINLSWTDNSSNENNFTVSRSATAGGPYTDIATLGANSTSYSNTGLSAGTTYYYVVRASNSSGSSANSNEASATTLANPPAAPSGLTATTASQTQINLAWTDNSSDETGFRVERSTDNVNFTQFVSLGANVTSTFDTGLTAATTYYYRVRAYNAAGNSAYSNTASATTLPNAPTAPSGLSATAASQTQINLAWTDNSSNEDSVTVSRSATAGGPYTDIATLGANSTSHNDTGLSAATTYYYVVRASNSGGVSANSNEASATTLPNPPAAPSGLSATAASSTQINLAWTDNSNNEANFIVARSVTAGGPYTDIATLGANATSHNDTGLSAGTTYYYVVRAINTGGSSVNSNEAGATTSPLPPAAPTGLAATVYDSARIDLTWVDVAIDESNYVVARGTTSGGPYTDIATLGANATSYSNTGLAENTTYHYVVRAVNAGGSSANSNQASGSTPLGLFIIDNPAATLVGAWSTGTTAVDKYGADYRFRSQGTGANYAQYTPSITTAGNYQVYEWHPQGANRTVGAPHVVTHSGGTSTVNVNQTVGGGAWNLIGTFNFAAGSAGNVRITDAFADAGQIVLADAIRFVYLPAPNAPSGLSASPASTSQINLSWTDNSGNEDSFIISRSTTSGGPYTDIATLGANATSYNDTGLSEGVMYYYVVRSRLLGVSSSNSNQANARTLVNEIIIDNPSATVVGSWFTGTSALDKYGADYRYKGGGGSGADHVTYTPNIVAGGNYNVYVWYPQGSNRPLDGRHIVNYNGGNTTVNVNQTTGGGTWQILGTYNFAAGTAGYVRITNTHADTTKSVMADGVRFVFVP